MKIARQSTLRAGYNNLWLPRDGYPFSTSFDEKFAWWATEDGEPDIGPYETLRELVDDHDHVAEYLEENPIAGYSVHEEVQCPRCFDDEDPVWLKDHAMCHVAPLFHGEVPITVACDCCGEVVLMGTWGSEEEMNRELDEVEELQGYPGRPVRRS